MSVRYWFREEKTTLKHIQWNVVSTTMKNTTNASLLILTIEMPNLNIKLTSRNQVLHDISACRPGKYGRQCSETCLYGYYGRQCKEICSCTIYEHCDPVSGCTCIDFTGKHCRFRCPEGYYGEHCGHVCQCLRGISCDSVTGSCLCPVGLTGPTCSTRCSDESYGRNCSKRCQCSQGLVCHSVLGTCQCENGTNDCKSFVPKLNHGNSSHMTLILAVSCSGGSLFFVGLLILIVCLLRRKHVQQSVNPQTRISVPEINHYDEINPIVEISLENMPIASDTSNIEPYYSYPQEHIRRLSLPNANGRMNNRISNDEHRRYMSLPNLSNIATYLSPYYSLQSGLNSITNNTTEQSLGSDNSGYLHPYNALRQPFDHHEYAKV
ncbi:Hypothetical predicted protein [Mytilus galloprovincialis]|uniref:Multiple epidermal growth factor-like domains protein 10 n=1 Tax=Mytilus galloprovincialis TaxID=29158 RepID=A0A8B6H749_MYTGA|nr:Hypothetical predicted protein [Mytilus galloprovincialis]